MISTMITVPIYLHIHTIMYTELFVHIHFYVCVIFLYPPVFISSLAGEGMLLITVVAAPVLVSITLEPSNADTGLPVVIMVAVVTVAVYAYKLGID